MSLSYSTYILPNAENFQRLVECGKYEAFKRNPLVLTDFEASPFYEGVWEPDWSGLAPNLLVSHRFSQPPTQALVRFGASRLLLLVIVCCADITFFGDFFMFHFTFEEGAWTKVLKTDRTFEIFLLHNAFIN